LKNILESLRHKRNINQYDLAKALGVSRQTISAIENGKYNPSLELAFAIADYFELKIEDIFFYERSSMCKNEEK